MNYLPRTTASLKHSFYENGNCPDFPIIADTQTTRLLDKHRCVVKPGPYGLTVYVQVENLLFTFFAGGGGMAFDLMLRRDCFALFTDPRFKLSEQPSLQIYQASRSVSSGQWISAMANIDEPSLSLVILGGFNQIKATPDADEIRFFFKPVLWLSIPILNNCPVLVIEIIFLSELIQTQNQSARFIKLPNSSPTLTIQREAQRFSPDGEGQALSDFRFFPIFRHSYFQHYIN